MPDISAIGAASPSLTNSQASLADNFEMFLTLLTEQMKNQDPLDPLDSTQFVNQLVDFSSVEQQISQNRNLESLLTLQSNSAETAAVSYIGRDATVSTPQTLLENGAAEWNYILPRDANSTSLIVRDQAGRLVTTINGENTSGTHQLTWDGTNSGGSPMPDGVYSLEVLANDSDGAAIPIDIQATARVTGIDLSGPEVIIEMGRLRAALSSVLSVQEGTAT